MYQPLIKFHPHPAIFTQVLLIFAILEIVFVVRVRKDIIESFSFKCQTQFAETILVLS